MEFYAVARVDMSPMAIQRTVHVRNLAEFCDSIDRVTSCQGDRGEIYCLWGEFKVHRELIRQGVRFTLPGCPNSLQWTITTMADDPAGVRVHTTIDPAAHDPEFVESLQQFTDDWKLGLEACVTGTQKNAPGAGAECLPIYG